MGWTSYHATNYKSGKIDRIAEVESQLNWNSYDKENGCKHTVLKSSQVGSAVYSAIEYIDKNGNREVFATIFLTSTNMRDYFNFSYKDMDETCGPYKHDCPKSILDLLTETDNEYANNWRKKCEEKRKAKNSPDSLVKLPVGSIIKFELQYDTTKHKKGESISLTKCQGWGRQRNYWSDGIYRWSNGILPKKYEVVS